MVTAYRPAGLFAGGVDPLALQAAMRQRRTRFQPRAPQRLPAPTSVIKVQSPLAGIGKGMAALGQGIGALGQAGQAQSIRDTQAEAAQVLARGQPIPAFKDPGVLQQFDPKTSRYFDVKPGMEAYGKTDQQLQALSSSLPENFGREPHFITAGTRLPGASSGAMYGPGTELIPERSPREAALQILARNP